MCVHHRSQLPHRPAFTLVELIVAIALVALLAGLAVLIFPQLQDSQRIVSGTDRVQGTLFLAKQLAVRDQLPRGVRLVINPSDGLVHSLQLIEQPDYFVAPAGSYLYGIPSNPSVAPMYGWPNNPTQPITQNLNVGLFSNVDFYGGNGPGNYNAATGQWSNQALWPVQPGDFLDLMGNNKPDGLYKIRSVNPSANPNTPTISDNLTLLSLLPANLLVSGAQFDSRLTYFVSNPPSPPYVPPTPPQPPIVDSAPRLPYRILRGPRVMVGQQPVSLPDNIVVDSSLSAAHPPAQFAGQNQWSLVTPDGQTGQVDIVFSPSGKVLRDAGTSGKAILWVYDSSDPTGGAQALVAVYTRTGIIAAQPAALNTNNPWVFVLDGRSSGM
jgi:prepilin-type N-terminal cleavage/methylation domain-containing protein